MTIIYYPIHLIAECVIVSLGGGLSYMSGFLRSANLSTYPIWDSFFFFNIYFFWVGSSLLSGAFSSCVQASYWSGSCCESWAPGHAGFSSCYMWAQQLWLTGSRVQAQQLWCLGLVGPWHAGSSWARSRVCVPWTAWQILNHCTTRKAPKTISTPRKNIIYISKKVARHTFSETLCVILQLFCNYSCLRRSKENFTLSRVVLTSLPFIRYIF